MENKERETKNWKREESEKEDHFEAGQKGATGGCTLL